MKEARYFYVPDAANTNELPAEEATHALRVLRLKSGDEMFLQDGNGTFYKAEVTLATTKHCMYEIKETMPQEKTWKGHICIAMAPTKMMDRTEWFVEKATELGVDVVSPVIGERSERKVFKAERSRKIALAAMKQSLKAKLPVVEEPVGVRDFILGHPEESSVRMICCCFEGETPRRSIADVLAQTPAGASITVLIGPEGDFSQEEARLAVERGYIPVHLGPSRLRTETAAVTAVTACYLRFMEP